MTMEFIRTRHRGDDSIHFQTEGLQVYLIGAAVLFASFGLGEAVYRLAFSDFDGAILSLALPAATVCHCMLLGASAPPHSSGPEGRTFDRIIHNSCYQYEYT
jgi:hypothetical protein